jgi:hypothetical protein
MTPARKPSLTSLLVTLAIATAIDIGAGLLCVRANASHRFQILIALLPIPANLVVVAQLVRIIRSLDEFLRQVHLEAVAIAFFLTGLAVFIYGYLQNAHAVPALNVGIVWVFMVLFYALGYLIAYRHYR